MRRFIIGTTANDSSYVEICISACDVKSFRYFQHVFRQKGDFITTRGQSKGRILEYIWFSYSPSSSSSSSYYYYYYYYYNYHHHHHHLYIIRPGAQSIYSAEKVQKV